MRNKMVFATGFALGYVLGARAGRERYEQISEAARAFAKNPQVQSTTSTLTHQASDVLGTAVHKAADVGGRMSSKVTDRLPGRFGNSGDEVGYPAHSAGRGNGQKGASGPAGPATGTNTPIADVP